MQIFQIMKKVTYQKQLAQKCHFHVCVTLHPSSSPIGGALSEIVHNPLIGDVHRTVQMYTHCQRLTP